MASSRLKRVIQTLRGAALPHDEAGLTDGQLLDNYVRSREEAAFAALVRRHGPMVWGVCRRILRTHQDAEDAFQATFLVLVRKAASVVPRDMVGNWLYGVAHQTARKARATTARRQAREKQVPAMPEPAGVQPEARDDLQGLLDQELSRLPDKYRAVIVLCDLEGKTRKEAAQHFHVPEGTVASRLATARRMLARRLTRPGLSVSGAALAAVLSAQGASASMPPAVASTTIRAAGLFAAGRTAVAGVLSAKSVALADRVLKTMLFGKLKLAVALLVALAVLGVGAVALTPPPPADKLAEPVEQAEQAVQVGPAVAVEKKPDPAIREPGGDWPQWRGRDRDGVVHDVTVPAKWPRTLTQEWRVPVGDGVASPVVVGGSIYVFTRQKDSEVVRCLDLAGGKEIWHSEPYPAPYQRGGGEGDFSIGPRSTPAVAGGRVFTFGLTGILSCLDAATGKLLWRKDYQPYPPYGGASPLAADGLCIIDFGDGKTGGLTAFDAVTGEVRWRHSDGGPTSASPLLVDVAGKRQVVTCTTGDLVGVSAASGRRLWRHGPFGAGTKIVTPVRYKDLLVFADNMEPPRAVRVTKKDKDFTVKEVWKAKGLTLNMSTPVLAGELLFGMSVRKQGSFFCLDANSGKTLWEQECRQQVGHASIVNAGSVLLLLTNDGRLVLIKPSATRYEPIAEYRVSDTATYAHPVLLGNRVLIKDASTLRSLRIEQ
jgi:RNA polymerase sigma factor (sigma-70 family)